MGEPICPFTPHPAQGANPSSTNCDWLGWRCTRARVLDLCLPLPCLAHCRAISSYACMCKNVRTQPCPHSAGREEKSAPAGGLGTKRITILGDNGSSPLPQSHSYTWTPGDPPQLLSGLPEQPPSWESGPRSKRGAKKGLEESRPQPEPGRGLSASLALSGLHRHPPASRPAAVPEAATPVSDFGPPTASLRAREHTIVLAEPGSVWHSPWPFLAASCVMEHRPAVPWPSLGQGTRQEPHLYQAGPAPATAVLPQSKQVLSVSCDGVVGLHPGRDMGQEGRSQQLPPPMKKKPPPRQIGSSPPQDCLSHKVTCMPQLTQGV